MKYIIDIPKTVGMTEKVGSVHYTYFDGIQCNTIILKSDEIEELNSEYVNEHFGDLQDEAYQKGLDDAWGAARKILFNPDDGGMSAIEVNEAFGESSWTVMKDFSPSEAIDKLKAYEEKQKADDKIEVGDVARWNSDEIVITRLYDDDGFVWCDGISKDGIAFHVLKENVTKTGRHFDIASILEDMRND